MNILVDLLALLCLSVQGGGKWPLRQMLGDPAASGGREMTEASSLHWGNALKHLNLSDVSCSHAGSHWSWPPDKLAALLDCPLGA
ncbi:hypothetical protein HNR03_000753 [Pseudomonas sp. JAI111]|uniref:hypothetical protein n=1 Tax=Pseudomonas sp. JAI111 TaxID=2735913 RepID=UPI00216A43A6|nr:hypothetical protein [Pseudomonas sp. JAI111]MCS3836173.1 hypothetical protein [Pseudomonas sp. JAI111]